MDERIAKDLAKEEPSKFHATMLSDCKALVAMSRIRMKSYHNQWDKHNDTYKGIRQVDKEDVAAKERSEPEKMVVPISYSQIMTFIAFCMSLYTQRERIFELTGFTPTDERPAKIGEALLARDLNHNKFKPKLFQFLLDIARFGFGVFKCSWSTETQMVRSQEEIPPITFAGMTFGKGKTQEVVKEVVSYQGNKIVNISPYRFFPDTRLPLTRFQEGEFCASEDVYSVSQLKQWQHDGEVAGVDYIPPMSKDLTTERNINWDTDQDPSGGISRGAGIKGDGQVKHTVLLTEVQRNIIPKDYEVDGEKLGPEDYPIKYVIWIANDSRVIKCEKMNYLHNQFTYTCSPFIFDNNSQTSGGLADTIDMLQSTISWFINSRITNVRKVIQNHLVVDQNFINWDDLVNRKPVIRLKQTAPVGIGIDRVIKQLQQQDVTVNHITDTKFLHELVQIVTGVNDALLGQFQPGRRSATEHRNTTGGSAARLRTQAVCIYDTGLETLADQMLKNLQDGLDEETYVQLMGQAKALANPEFVAVTKEDIVGRYAFEQFDGTLPSERLATSKDIFDIISGFLSSPEGAAYFGLDARAMLFEAMSMKGIHNPERFSLPPQPQILQQPTEGQNGQPTNGATTPGPNGTASGLPGTLPEPLLSPFARGVSA